MPRKKLQVLMDEAKEILTRLREAKEFHKDKPGEAAKYDALIWIVKALSGCE